MLNEIEKNSDHNKNEPLLKVLVADDDLPTRMLLRAAMNQWGYEVVEASDGEEAWDILQKDSPPMLLVVDWLMPRLDGIELSKRIKKELNLHPYIILLTQVTGTPNIVKALEAGADEFLTKPFNMAELRSRLSVGAKILGYKNIVKKQSQQIKELGIKSNNVSLNSEDKQFHTEVKNLLIITKDFSSDIKAIMPDIKIMSEEKGGLYISHAQKIQNSLDTLESITNKLEEQFSKTKSE